MYSSSPKAKRLEFRCPDPTCNPYLSFSAILMAAIDGIQNKIDPGEPLDKDIYDLEPEELAKVPKTPGSLEDAVKALRADHDFLLRGDVFTPDVIDTWIWYKHTNEVQESSCGRILTNFACIMTFKACRLTSERRADEHVARMFFFSG